MEPNAITSSVGGSATYQMIETAVYAFGSLLGLACLLLLGHTVQRVRKTNRRTAA